MKYKRLDQSGFSHWIALVVFVLIVAAVGTRVLTMGHASSPGIVEHVSYTPKAMPQIPRYSDLKAQSTTTSSPGCMSLVTHRSYYCWAALNWVNVDTNTGTPLHANGASITMTIQHPKLVFDYHSLAELWVGSPDASQAVEIGWTVDLGVNGDVLPHLFVYHWVNGAASCYNGCGFVPLAGKTHAGSLLSAGSVGKFTIKHQPNYHRWWLGYNDSPVGVFPDSLWGNTFTQIGRMQTYGEIAGSSAKPKSQMGNGIFGSKAGAARIHDVTLLAPSAPATFYGSTVPVGNGGYDQGHVTATAFSYGGPGFQ